MERSALWQRPKWTRRGQPHRSILDRPSFYDIWFPSMPLRPVLWLQVCACCLDGSLTPTSCQWQAERRQTVGGHPQRFPATLRASTWPRTSKPKSRTSTLVISCGPPSRQMRAIALSRAHPRRPNTLSQLTHETRTVVCSSVVTQVDRESLKARTQN